MMPPGSPGDVGLSLIPRHIVAEGVRHGRAIAAIITGHVPGTGAHWPGHTAPGAGVSAAVEHVQQVPPALGLSAATAILHHVSTSTFPILQSYDERWCFRCNTPILSSWNLVLTSAMLMLVTSPWTPPELVTGKLRKMLSLAGMFS